MVAFFVARRGVSIETRGKHEGALSAMLWWCLSSVSKIIRIVFLCKRIFKRCLFLIQILFTERQPGGLNTILLERANEGHGEHRASREAGHGAHWGRGAVELDPDRIDGEVIAGGRVASRVTERDGRFNFFVF